jgi:hypothetical protein
MCVPVCCERLPASCRVPVHVGPHGCITCISQPPTPMTARTLSGLFLSLKPFLNIIFSASVYSVVVNVCRVRTGGHVRGCVAKVSSKRVYTWLILRRRVWSVVCIDSGNLGCQSMMGGMCAKVG